jgi:hypothetical protein
VKKWKLHVDENLHMYSNTLELIYRMPLKVSIFITIKNGERSIEFSNFSKSWERYTRKCRVLIFSYFASEATERARAATIQPIKLDCGGTSIVIYFCRPADPRTASCRDG